MKPKNLIVSAAMVASGAVFAIPIDSITAPIFISGASDNVMVRIFNSADAFHNSFVFNVDAIGEFSLVLTNSFASTTRGYIQFFKATLTSRDRQLLISPL